MQYFNSMSELVKEIYIAGPDGFSEAGRDFHYQKIIPTLEKLGYGILDPWTLTDSNLISSVVNMDYGQEKKEAWAKLNPIIFRNNVRAIGRCAGVFANLDGVDVDSGTASEIANAWAWGKRILGYKSDFRLTADNEGGLVNLQVEGYIWDSGGTIISSTEQLPDAAKKVFGDPNEPTDLAPRLPSSLRWFKEEYKEV